MISNSSNFVPCLLIDVFLGLLLHNFGFWGEEIKTIQIINNLSLDIK